MNILKGLQRSTKIGLSIAAVFCAVLFGAIFTSSSVHAATTNKCRTMIYRSDTAGYTSGYVEVCADVKGDGTISKITSVNSNGTKGVILANVDAHLYDNNNQTMHQQITVCRYSGSSCESGTKTQFFIGDKLGPADKKISQVYTKFSEYTDKVLYGVSDLVGYNTSQVVDDSRSDCENMIDNFCTTIPGTKKITYSYNGIYDGSYSDWENAGYPDGQGQTYTQPQDPNDPNAAGGGATSGSSETDPCYSNAESLGWILCPLTTWLNNALGSVYENIVEPFLQIDSGLVSTKNEGTYAAWGVFRNMANIVFVILILVVVFSQVTGVGINNYGIKKALPKIIVVAILINLSYILCQLAVDVSNILGSGVENLLTGIGDKISGLSPKGSTSTPVQQMQNILGGLLTAVGIGAAGAAAAVVMGGAGIVVLLLSLVSALLSVIFFFIILGLRKAGVVLLVALAPLAIVCAALPNTDKIFQRWLGIFKALLFVYPIAGALIGGGYLAAVILLQAGGSDAWLQIIAMLLFVVPFLALPSLLKKSIAGADQIFGSIVNKGEGLTAKARGGVQNSDVMKRNRERTAQNRTAFKARGKVWRSNKAAGLLDKMPGRLTSKAAGRVRMGAKWAQDAKSEADVRDLEKYTAMAMDEHGNIDINEVYRRGTALSDKAAKTGLSNDEKKEATAYMHYLTQIKDAKGLTQMVGKNNGALMEVAHQRSLADHGIVDVMGGDKGDKALSKAVESGGGAPRSEQYKEAVGGMTALEVANQQGATYDNYGNVKEEGARTKLLREMADKDLNDAVNNADIMGKMTPEARKEFTAEFARRPQLNSSSQNTQSGHQQHNASPQNAQPEQVFNVQNSGGSGNNGPTNPTPPQPPSVPTP